MVASTVQVLLGELQALRRIPPSLEEEAWRIPSAADPCVGGGGGGGEEEEEAVAAAARRRGRWRLQGGGGSGGGAAVRGNIGPVCRGGWWPGPPQQADL